MKAAIRMLPCVFILLLSACSGENEVTDNHVFKAQTDALEKARGVEQLLQNADAKNRLELERQTE